MVQRTTQKSKAKASTQKSTKAAKQTGKPPIVNGHGSEKNPEAGKKTRVNRVKSVKVQIQIAEPDSTKQILDMEPSMSAGSHVEPGTSKQNVDDLLVTEAESTTKDSEHLAASSGADKSNTRTVRKKEVKETSKQVPATSKSQTRSKQQKVESAEPEKAEIEKDDPKEKVTKSRKRRVVNLSKPNPEIPGTSRKDGKAVASSRSKAKRQKLDLEIPSLRHVTGGKVFVIGENDVGQLGFGEEVEVKRRPVMLELPFPVADVVAGGMHSVCLTENGEVITFGCNDEGALGRVTSEEGSECIPRKVDIPERIVQASAGDSHTAALAESGQVYVWGNFRSGDGHMGLTPDGAKQVKPVKILTDVSIVKIASGSDHLVCLSKEGIIYTCGCGETGQLGRIAERFSRDGGRKGRSVLLEPALIPITKSQISVHDVWTGAYSTFFRAHQTGSIYAFGLNNYNHLGFTNENACFFPKQVTSFNDQEWKQINGGQHHTLALNNEGKVFSLGRSDYGRLGLGENSGEREEPSIIPTLENEKCSDISCGNCVSFALNEKGSVYSWGFGTNHQLGHGNDEDCHVPTCIEGRFFDSWKAHKVSGGGQHTLILASPKESSTKSD